MSPLGRRVAIVVLGDLGRSPRMQYHALALANDGAEVDLIGYTGRPADRAVAEHPRITLHLLAPPWRQRAPRALYLPAAMADLAAQTARLLHLLLVTLPRPDYVLVQNPPALPTLLVARIVARLRAAKLVVDWHNFGSDMLALRLGHTHPLVRTAAAVERFAGRGADAHLCVSQAMQNELAERWGVSAAHILRDRPAKRVGRTPLAARKALFERLDLGFDPSAPDRPALIVSSSSWTADEDFSLLLEAMVRCEEHCRARLLFVLTGDGPLRTHWEGRFAALGLRRIATRTVWVAAEDYPLLLGSADLGLSFHRSASGVDLPMKIADMFGAGLPVCALEYGAVLGELVHAHENGLLFSSGSQLGAQLVDLFNGFPDHTAQLDRLRGGVEQLATIGWAEGWATEAARVFRPEGTTR